MIISENFCVFPFVKTSGYHLKVFVFKLNQIHICQTTIVEKHLCQYYVRINEQHEQIKTMTNHDPFCRLPPESVCFQIESNSHLSDDNC